MVSPHFTTGPVTPGPAQAPGPRMELASAKDSPYADPAPASPDGNTVPPLPLIPPGKVTTRLETPHELAASAGIARQIATDLDSANGKAGPGTHSLTEYASTASTKIRGFSFGGALTGSTERWMQQCKTLHGKLGSAADNLDRTRQYYHSNEADVAAAFRSGQ